ncbi:MAG: ABC transporter ATP-binding protein [Burkholderiales bacterium]|nr:ABC transporter ATP-binding protein [Burkholderiales bacterium]
MSLLKVDHLEVSFRLPEARRIQAVQDLSFDIDTQRILGIVGESGSGKSVTAMSLLRLLPRNAEIRGRVQFAGRNLLELPERDLRRVRGRDIGMIFQDPGSALNPVLSIGQQLLEPLQLHLKLSRAKAREKALALLEEVGIPEPRARLKAYPHELSGGQQQRVMIAMALACEPALLIADEPTTALDVTVQRQIIDLLLQLHRQRKMSLLFISHDLNLVGQIAHEVLVMRGGEMQECGATQRVFHAPQSDYARQLLAARPQLQLSPPIRTLSDRVLLEVQQLNKVYRLRTGLWQRKNLVAVRDVSFQVRQGSTLGIVGESGSGKTTTALMLLGLVPASSGQVLLDGKNLLTQSSAEWRQLRKRLQVVFQNPYASLNPRFSIAQTLTEPMQIHGLGGTQQERQQRAVALLQRVGLEPAALGQYPHEFSGGQRQRIALARALAVEPEIIVFDEALSALDVSVQADILKLLRDLQQERGLTYLFISHDLAVVSLLADDILVLRDGRVVEAGSVQKVLQQPGQAYTSELLQAAQYLYTDPVL